MAATKANFTDYEWDYELTNLDEEVIDRDCWDHLRGRGLPDSTPDANGEFLVLVLVKDVYRGWALKERSWAYVKDGKLPEYFGIGTYHDWDEGYSKVPQRFHQELAAEHGRDTLTHQEKEK